jgi:hypothetical protein
MSWLSTIREVKYGIEFDPSGSGGIYEKFKEAESE